MISTTFQKRTVSMLLLVMLASTIIAHAADTTGALPSVPYPMGNKKSVYTTLHYADGMDVNGRPGVYPTPTFQPGNAVTFSLNGAGELRYDARMLIEVGIHFINDLLFRGSSFHLSPGGFAWYPVAGSGTSGSPYRIKVPADKVDVNLRRMGRPFRGYAFLIYNTPDSSIDYATDCIIVGDGNSFYVDAENVRNIRVAGYTRDDLTPPDAPVVINSENKWKKVNPTLYPSIPFTYNPNPVSIGSGRTIVFVEPQRPEFGLTGWTVIPNTSKLALFSEWESLSSTPYHSKYVLYTIDLNTDIVTWTGETTGNEGYFEVDPDTFTGLVIQAIDTSGNVYAESFGYLTTPSLPTTQTAKSAESFGNTDSEKDSIKRSADALTFTLTNQTYNKFSGTERLFPVEADPIQTKNRFNFENQVE